MTEQVEKTNYYYIHGSTLVLVFYLFSTCSLLLNISDTLLCSSALELAQYTSHLCRGTIKEITDPSSFTISNALQIFLRICDEPSCVSTLCSYEYNPKDHGKLGIGDPASWSPQRPPLRFVTCAFFALVSLPSLPEGNQGPEVSPQHRPAERGRWVDANQPTDEGVLAALQQCHDVRTHVIRVLLPEVLRNSESERLEYYISHSQIAQFESYMRALRKTVT